MSTTTTATTTNLVDNWLEDCLQEQFKKLNFMVRSISNARDERQNIELFFHRQSTLSAALGGDDHGDDDHDDRRRRQPHRHDDAFDSRVNGKQQRENETSTKQIKDYLHQWPSWWNKSRRRQSTSSSIILPTSLTTTGDDTDDNKQQQQHQQHQADSRLRRSGSINKANKLYTGEFFSFRRKKMSSAAASIVPNVPQAEDAFDADRIRHVERLLTQQQPPAGEHRWNTGLVCLAFAKPSDGSPTGAGQCSSGLLFDYYSDPSEDYKCLRKLSGMFITLYEVAQMIDSRSCLHLIDVELNVGSSPPGQLRRRPYRLCLWNSSEQQPQYHQHHHQAPKPIFVVLALPSEHYTRNQTSDIGTLFVNILRLKFGSLWNAFNFLPNHAYIYQILNMLQPSVLLSVHARPKMNLSTSMLHTSGAFFLHKFAATQDRNKDYACLVLQQLIADDLTSLRVSNYLNDHDSLDWLQEAIVFYRNGGEDIESSLSEHFARCMQLEVDEDVQHQQQQQQQHPTTNRTKMSAAKQAAQLALFTNKLPKTEDDRSSQHKQPTFDLLELELSAFMVAGSCLFYRQLCVQSHLTPREFDQVRQFCLARGLFIATKHSSLDLVFFGRFDEQRPPSRRPRFLLIIGFQHLLLCSLVEVNSFNRSHYGALVPPTDAPEDALDHGGQQQYPSAFAFYVFIKESFRLLCFYLNKFHLLDRLEKLYELNLATRNKVLHSHSQGTTTKKKKKKKKKSKKSKNDNKIKRKLSQISFMSKFKPTEVKGPNSATLERTSIKIRNEDDRTVVESTTSTSSSRSSDSLDKEGASDEEDDDDDRSPSEHSNSSQFGSCTSSSSRSPSPQLSAELKIEKVRPEDIEWPTHVPGASVYKAAHTRTPFDCLVSFMFVDSGQGITKLYGPITSSSSGKEQQQQQQQQLIARLNHELDVFRNNTRKMSIMCTKRRRGHRALMVATTSTTTATGIVGRRSATSATSTVLDLGAQHGLFYLVGECCHHSAVAPGRAGDEFYACFKMDTGARAGRGKHSVLESLAKSSCGSQDSKKQSWLDTIHAEFGLLRTNALLGKVN